MNSELRNELSILDRELLNKHSFPMSPFRKPDWIGIVFNRDQHAATGIPRYAFDAVISALIARGQFEGLSMIPALFHADGEPIFETAAVSSWSDYLTVIEKSDYIPEYFLTTPSLSFLVWIDTETALMGGERSLMQMAIGSMGGLRAVSNLCAREFGVEIDDGSQMAAYIRAVTGMFSTDGEPLS
jgi:hypothetical protein